MLEIFAIIHSRIHFALNDRVLAEVIHLRQQGRMKLGDEILAATALVNQVPRVKCNEAHFKPIHALDWMNPFTLGHGPLCMPWGGYFPLVTNRARTDSQRCPKSREVFHKLVA